MRIRKATHENVEGICQVCAEGYRDAYGNLLPESYIERVIAEFYNEERVSDEVLAPEGWNGWWIAEENAYVLGAGGGAIMQPGVSELFVLYLDPLRRGEGIGTLLLNGITEELRSQGALEQWLSVLKGNDKGIPFYEARGFEHRGEKQAYGSTPEENIVSLRMRRDI